MDGGADAAVVVDDDGDDLEVVSAPVRAVEGGAVGCASGCVVPSDVDIVSVEFVILLPGIMPAQPERTTMMSTNTERPREVICTMVAHREKDVFDYDHIIWSPTKSNREIPRSPKD